MSITPWDGTGTPTTTALRNRQGALRLRYSKCYRTPGDNISPLPPTSMSSVVDCVSEGKLRGPPPPDFLPTVELLSRPFPVQDRAVGRSGSLLCPSVCQGWAERRRYTCLLLGLRRVRRTPIFNDVTQHDCGVVAIDYMQTCIRYHGQGRHRVC